MYSTVDVNYRHTVVQLNVFYTGSQEEGELIQLFCHKPT